jgi:hypothetical protein
MPLQKKRKTWLTKRRLPSPKRKKRKKTVWTILEKLSGKRISVS